MVAVLFFPVLAVAVAWKLYQWSKDPRDAPLRSVTLCLVCAAASYPLAMPGGASGFDTVAGHGAGKLAQNVLLLVTVYFLMCFYLYSSADEKVGRLRARWEGIGALVVIGVITAAVLTAPGDQVLAGSFSTADMTIPQVAVFYLFAGLYLLYALAAAGWWTRRYARMSQRPHATGLWLAAAGLFGMAAACAIRAVFVIVRSRSAAVPEALTAGVALLLVVSISLFVIGVSYPGARARLAALRVWQRHRRVHRQLQPLWVLLSDAYPESVLKPASVSWRDRWSARGVNRRYHRRVVECRDGLVRISAYLHDHNTGGALLDMAPEALAEHLRNAATAVGQGIPEPRRAIALAMPHRDDRDTDVQQLVALSNALRAKA